MDMKEIKEIAVGLDEHLRKIESYVPILYKVKASLDAAINSQNEKLFYEIEKLKKDVHNLSEQLKKHGLHQPNNYEKQLQESRDLLNSSEWPNAVDPEMICDDNEEKQNQRAESILDLLISERLKGKKFLDFGCGNGNTIPQAQIREAEFVLGYDVKFEDLKFPITDFTTNFVDVRSKGPYDIVLVHDVLDHIVLIDPIQALRQIHSILSMKGRVYIRNHPWSSRHGGHLYSKLNKAFIHLAFDETELVRINGLQCDPNIRITNPLETYRYWFDQAGFKIVSEIAIRDEVEHFFLKPSVINDRISKNFEDKDSMKDCLSISFVEYILEPIKSNQQIF